MPRRSSKNYKISFVIIILLIFLTIAVCLCLFLYLKMKNENTVGSVVDGDTFQLNSGKRIRLLGVYAPEYDRCGGSEAKEFLTKLILGKRVEILNEIPEKYGRVMALVYTGKILVNEQVLAEGYGRPDYRNNPERNRLTNAYKAARRQYKGALGLCRSEENTENNCNIKGNIDAATSKKFYHYPACSHYTEIVIEKDRGEQYFCSEKEAIEAGFEKAAGCP
jgi:micrococcal nuclease